MVKFEATNQEQCDAKMREHCNDGRCWTVSEVFSLVTARPYDTARNVPRAPVDASDLQSLYWQSGEWHKRRPATAAMQRKVWAQADKAGGVSDGGNVDVAAWFRARARKLKRQEAKRGIQ